MWFHVSYDGLVCSLQVEPLQIVTQTEERSCQAKEGSVSQVLGNVDCLECCVHVVAFIMIVNVKLKYWEWSFH